MSTTLTCPDCGSDQLQTVALSETRRSVLAHAADEGGVQWSSRADESTVADRFAAMGSMADAVVSGLRCADCEWSAGAVALRGEPAAHAWSAAEVALRDANAGRMAAAQLAAVFARGVKTGEDREEVRRLSTAVARAAGLENDAVPERVPDDVPIEAAHPDLDDEDAEIDDIEDRLIALHREALADEDEQGAKHFEAKLAEHRAGRKTPA